MISSLRSQYFLHGNVKSTQRSSGDCCVNCVLGSEDINHPKVGSVEALFHVSSPPCYRCHNLSRLLPPSSSVLAYQRPNAKKLRRIAQKAEKLTAKGVVTRRQKRLLVRPKLDDTAKKAELEPNNNPERDYYDIWRQECELCACFLCVCVCSMCVSSDDHILALWVFPSWEWEDKHGALVTVV